MRGSLPPPLAFMSVRTCFCQSTVAHLGPCTRRPAQSTGVKSHGPTSKSPARSQGPDRVAGRALIRRVAVDQVRRPVVILVGLHAKTDARDLGPQLHETLVCVAGVIPARRIAGITPEELAGIAAPETHEGPQRTGSGLLQGVVLGLAHYIRAIPAALHGQQHEDQVLLRVGGRPDGHREFGTDVEHAAE